MLRLSRASVNPQQYPPKVLQFGDGNFLRGFADWMIDVLNEQTAFSGSVVIVAPLRRGRQLHDEQDGLYHVVFRGLSAGVRIDNVRLVTCVNGYVDPYGDYDAFIATADIPSLKLVVSNTTEAGISFNDRDLQAHAPADSFPAKVTQLLYRRFQTFKGDRSKGWVFLPCELIEANGDALRNIVLQYAALWNLPDSFVSWVDDACLFCNTLVDRIVTGYPGDDAAGIMKRIGVQDDKLVTAEPYHLWAIQAAQSLNEVFPVGDTDLNVKFVPDITPYRTSKVRILNGAHTAMTLIGYLRGLRTVREAAEDRWMSRFLNDMVHDEIIPTIPLPADEMKEYARIVFERFLNPEIRHELKSIALNSVSKFRARLLPSIVDRYAATGELPEHLITAFAALLVFYKGAWKGQPLPVNDHPDVLKALQSCWTPDGQLQLMPVLSNRSLWGTDLTKFARLDQALIASVQNILYTF